MLCKHIGFGLVFACLLACTTAAMVKNVNNDLPAAIETVRPTIVQIGYIATEFQKDTEQARLGQPFIKGTFGTGFLVSDGYVITAWHVVADGQKWLEKIRAAKKAMYVNIAFPNYVGKSITSLGNFQAVGFDIVDKDTNNDVVLLKIHLRLDQIRAQARGFIVSKNEEVPTLSIGTAVLNLQTLQDGVSVAVSGYPLNQPILITTSGHLAARWSLGSLKTPVVPIPTVSDVYLADLHVNSGNSGGPAYLLHDGSVIGVCVAFQGDYVRGPKGEPLPLTFNSGLANIIPAKYVATILKKNNVKFREISDKE